MNSMQIEHKMYNTKIMNQILSIESNGTLGLLRYDQQTNVRA